MKYSDIQPGGVLVALPGMAYNPLQRACLLVTSVDPTLTGFILNKPVLEITNPYLTGTCYFFGGYLNTQTQFYLTALPIRGSLKISESLYYSFDTASLQKHINEQKLTAENFKLVVGQCIYGPAYFKEHLLSSFTSVELPFFGTPFGHLNGVWEQWTND